MKEVIGAIVVVAGFVGIIGSALAVKFSAITAVILIILKLTGILTIAWFAGPFTAGAISTGLWMLFLGLIMIVVSGIITAVGTSIIEA